MTYVCVCVVNSAGAARYRVLRSLSRSRALLSLLLGGPVSLRTLAKSICLSSLVSVAVNWIQAQFCILHSVYFWNRLVERQEQLRSYKSTPFVSLFRGVIVHFRTNEMCVDIPQYYVQESHNISAQVRQSAVKHSISAQRQNAPFSAIAQVESAAPAQV